jgi:hypothetical protein
MRSDGGILFFGMTASFGFVLLIAGLWVNVINQRLPHAALFFQQF